MMKRRRSENALDAFRLPAAFLVIAIHTSPLSGISADADFFLTRIAARIAVPFFLMITGQYVLGGLWDHAGGEPIRHFLKKTVFLYGAAIVIYLPIGIYAGLYEHMGIMPLLRMLLFDGTFYHLWYFPACMLGVLFVCLLKRILPFRGAFAVTAALYVIGLFGDSYYGIAAMLPWVKGAYDAGFRLFSYTRNGLFFSPLFLMLGILAGRKASAGRRGRYLTGFAACMALMTVEGFVLRLFELQRHDSMYAMLPFCVYFGFRWLLTGRRRMGRTVRTVAAWIYILHPAIIVAVRGAAKAAGLTGLLVENSVVHYAAVGAVSFIAAAVVAEGLEIMQRRKHTLLTGRAWIELNRGALRQNVAALREQIPDSCGLMPAVKADAYGHGAVLIARELRNMGVSSFCVASAKEGAQLRKAGIGGTILVLGYTHADQFWMLKRYRLTQTVVDLSHAKQLNGWGRKLHVHIAVDTGMHRLGERSDQVERICSIYRMKNLIVDGIYTHLCADDGTSLEERAFTARQADGFYHVVEQLREQGFACPTIHLLSSYGILNYPEFAEDYLRVGIALYGVFGTKEDTQNSRIALTPVLSLKARVASVRKVFAGETVGYGLTCTAKEEMTVAALAIGYADGLPRSLSDGVGEVLLYGRRAPIVGKICMDQTLVDVSGIPEVKAGDTAVLIGKSGAEEIFVCDIAERTGTITNEVLSRLGKRLERTVTE